MTNTQTRIDRCFDTLRQQGRKGFIAYITAGDPTIAATEDTVLRLEDAGVDVVELGIPFSDPLADGRVNQESAVRALEAGATPEKINAMVARLRARTQIPLLYYTYLNLMLPGGFGHSLSRLAKAGTDGVLVLDLPVEELGPYEADFARHSVNNIALVTPTSPDDRIRKIVGKATGFVYCVSRTGVTGMQKNVSADAADIVVRTRRHTKLPIALGFGISNPEQAREIASGPADAVVVGSAIVSKFHAEGDSPEGRARAARWVGRMVKAVHGV